MCLLLHWFAYLLISINNFSYIMSLYIRISSRWLTLPTQLTRFFRFDEWMRITWAVECTILLTQSNITEFSMETYGFDSEGSCRISDFSLTNSLATSSLFLWDRMRRIVQPVSSIWIRFASDNQQAQEPYMWQ